MGKIFQTHKTDKKKFLFGASNKGTGHATKSVEFWGKLQGGGVSFSIQKFMLQILGTLNFKLSTGLFEHELDTKLPKRSMLTKTKISRPPRGSKWRPLNISPILVHLVPTR